MFQYNKDSTYTYVIWISDIQGGGENKVYVAYYFPKQETQQEKSSSPLL